MLPVVILEGIMFKTGETYILMVNKTITRTGGSKAGTGTDHYINYLISYKQRVQLLTA